MAKLKFWNGTAWKELDAKNLTTINDLYLRVSSGNLQYSTNGTTWINAT